MEYPQMFGLSGCVSNCKNKDTLISESGTLIREIRLLLRCDLVLKGASTATVIWRLIFPSSGWMHPWTDVEASAGNYLMHFHMWHVSMGIDEIRPRP